MNTGMTRLGRRLPSRTLAVPTIPYRRLATHGGKPVALALVMDAGPDTIELIVTDHERIRRLRKNDGDAATARDPDCPGAQPGVGPMRRRPVHSVALEMGMRVVSRFRCRSIRIGVLLAHRDADPMDGCVLADLLVLAHARRKRFSGRWPPLP